ncbi:heavy metal-associated isoprenylated plant protein 6-like [Lycium ferocissimum]|uniref:heavy metal-associated isoprenylated plant protein 6-like n=1 Tax=Lycium ferocissimum TaxID=112874 RepID=UPI0028158834|nr:heavy metal-associated isoprenylated plant protein 6-like [Lycium ferocissimum]
MGGCKTEETTTMVLEVDLQCCSCYKKVKKILCKFPQIRDQLYDEKANTVTITVVCCNPEKIRDKLCSKGCRVIKCIKIKRPKPGKVDPLPGKVDPPPGNVDPGKIDPPPGKVDPEKVDPPLQPPPSTPQLIAVRKECRKFHTLSCARELAVTVKELNLSRKNEEFAFA